VAVPSEGHEDVAGEEEEYGLHGGAVVEQRCLVADKSLNGCGCPVATGRVVPVRPFGVGIGACITHTTNRLHRGQEDGEEPGGVEQGGRWVPAHL
jgi:hypothetical protein